MQSARAPKQWPLQEGSSLNEFEIWKQNLLYQISMDHRFTRYLEATWLPKSAANPTHGFTDDEQDHIPWQSAAQKNKDLELMLGQIANYCTIIARDDFLKRATSLADVWQRIRLHLGFQKSGAQFLDLATYRLENERNERPEALFQRLNSFYQDSLITQHGGLTHHGEIPTVDEDMSPTIENTVVFLWLQMIHPGLPALVKQKYGAELRRKTLASLKPEISIALSSLLDELRSVEEAKAFRSNTDNFSRRRYPAQAQHQQPQQKGKACTLCKAAGKSDFRSHWLRQCPNLTDGDRKAFAKSRSAVTIDQQEYSDDDVAGASNHHSEDEDPLIDNLAAPTRRVEILASPELNCFYGKHPIRLTLDSGATSNMIKDNVATRLRLPIQTATQGAHQADGVTPMNVVGETHINISRGPWRFQLDTLIVRKLDVDFLAGMPFMAQNDIAVRPARKLIVIQGKETVPYVEEQRTKPTARIIRSTVSTVILPGEFVELQTPPDISADEDLIVEPRYDTLKKGQAQWLQPQTVKSVANTIRLENTTTEPVSIPKNSHICQVRTTVDPDSVNIQQGTSPLDRA